MFSQNHSWANNTKSAWNIDVSSYGTSINLPGTLITQTFPTGISFGPDGKSMYILDTPTKKIAQYSLSSAYDLFSTIAQVSTSDVYTLTYPMGLCFSADGKNVYVTDNSEKKVVQYKLPTAWSLSSIKPPPTYSLLNFTEYTAGKPNLLTFAFGLNGTRMYVVEYSSSMIYQSNLGIAWDITTTYNTSPWYKYNFKTKNSGNAASNISPYNIVFSDNGMILLSISNGNASRYNLNTAWAINTAYFVYNFPLLVTADAGGAAGTCICFKPAGLTSYISTNRGNIHQFTGAYAWDPRPTDTPSFTFSATSQMSSISLIEFSMNGTRLYAFDTSTGKLCQYNLSIAWELSSAAYVSSIYVKTYDAAPTSVKFSMDGMIMYVLGNTTDKIYRYELSIAGDISTAAHGNVGVSVNSPIGVKFNKSGTMMYIANSAESKIEQYTLSTAWDVLTATLAGEFSISSNEASVSGFTFSPDGAQLFVTGLSSDSVHRFDLGVLWDVTSASYKMSYSHSAQTVTSSALEFNPTGTRMFLASGFFGNTAQGKVFQYNI
jgi:sugar lactone lactonase YvrE